MRRLRVVAAIVALIVAAAVAVVLSPLNPANPGRDAGVFIYVAEQILDGRLPYVATWDHKPPGIYYVDALGLAIARGHLFGVWFVELFSAAVSAFLSWRIFRRSLTLEMSLFCVIGWVTAWIYIVHGAGNYTEEFGIPFQFAALLMVSREEREHASRDAILVALLGVCAFLLKPTIVGIWIALGVDWLFRRGESSLRRRVVPAIAAGSAGLVAIALSFRTVGAFHDLVDQFIRYNAVYGKTAHWSDRLAGANESLTRLALAGVVVAGVVAFVGFLFSRDRRDLFRDPLLRVAMLAFPLDFVLSLSTGRNYDHYFISILPSASVLFAIFASHVASRSRRLYVTALAGFLLVVSTPVIWTVNEAMQVALGLRLRLSDTIATAESTPADRSFLVWGAEVEINAIAHRRAPGRYAYLYPLLTNGYATAGRGEEFLRDLERDPPAVIIDSSPTNDLIPPLDSRRSASWTPKPPYERVDVVQPALQYIRRFYRPTKTLQLCRWVVWTRIPEHHP